MVPMTCFRSWSLPLFTPFLLTAAVSAVLAAPPPSRPRRAAPPRAQSPAALTVVRTGPEGPLDSAEQAREIRVVFSEPMVTTGRIPSPVTAPFVRIRPAVPGTFRWSGTTILIFTPDPQQPLPYATTYTVTVDATATAVSTRRLAGPVTFRSRRPP